MYFPRWFWNFLYLIERLSDYRYLALRGDGWSKLEKNSERSRQHIKEMKRTEGVQEWEVIVEEDGWIVESRLSRRREGMQE